MFGLRGVRVDRPTQTPARVTRQSREVIVVLRDPNSGRRAARDCARCRALDSRRRSRARRRSPRATARVIVSSALAIVRPAKPLPATNRMSGPNVVRGGRADYVKTGHRSFEVFRQARVSAHTRNRVIEARAPEGILRQLDAEAGAEEHVINGLATSVAEPKLQTLAGRGRLDHVDPGTDRDVLDAGIQPVGAGGPDRAAVERIVDPARESAGTTRAAR